MTPPLYFVTSNVHKLNELKAILNHSVERVDIDVPEIQSLDLEAVVKAKAEAAHRFVQAPVIVEDVSLELAAWNGLPGPFVKWFNQTLGPAGIARLMRTERDRRVRAREIVDLYDGETHRLFEGVAEGNVADEPRGESGFGFDVIFIPDGHALTYAEMSAQQKNRISHRAQALHKLETYLKSSGA